MKKKSFLENSIKCYTHTLHTLKPEIGRKFDFERNNANIAFHDSVCKFKHQLSETHVSFCRHWPIKVSFVVCLAATQSKHESSLYIFYSRTCASFKPGNQFFVQNVFS